MNHDSEFITPETIAKQLLADHPIATALQLTTCPAVAAWLRHLAGVIDRFGKLEPIASVIG